MNRFTAVHTSPLIKDTSIREGMRLRFSAQSLNAFNHPLRPAPNLTPSNTLFGSTSGSTQANYPGTLLTRGLKRGLK